MKVIVEIDTNEDMKKVEKFLKFLDPSIIRTSNGGKAHKIQGFLDFIEEEATVVEKISIPRRKERPPWRLTAS